MCVCVCVFDCVSVYSIFSIMRNLSHSRTHETAHIREQKIHYNFCECTTVKFACRACRTLTLMIHAHSHTYADLLWCTYDFRHININTDTHTPTCWYSLIFHKICRRGDTITCPDVGIIQILRMHMSCAFPWRLQRLRYIYTSTHTHTHVHW